MAGYGAGAVKNPGDVRESGCFAVFCNAVADLDGGHDDLDKQDEPGKYELAPREVRDEYRADEQDRAGTGDSDASDRTRRKCSEPRHDAPTNGRDRPQPSSEYQSDAHGINVGDTVLRSDCPEGRSCVEIDQQQADHGTTRQEPQPEEPRPLFAQYAQSRDTAFPSMVGQGSNEASGASFPGLVDASVG